LRTLEAFENIATVRAIALRSNKGAGQACYNVVTMKLEVAVIFLSGGVVDAG
jgi:hypothetical protein